MAALIRKACLNASNLTLQKDVNFGKNNINLKKNLTLGEFVQWCLYDCTVLCVLYVTVLKTVPSSACLPVSVLFVHKLNDLLYSTVLRCTLCGTLSIIYQPFVEVMTRLFSLGKTSTTLSSTVSILALVRGDFIKANTVWWPCSL